jgi:two-component system chemotaxis response regulator CheY
LDKTVESYTDVHENGTYRQDFPRTRRSDVGKRILVVDDSQTIRQQVSTALRQAAFDTAEASDGADGLSAIANAPDTAMIICDVNMPRMNGIEMVEALQKLGSRIPVVMLTTEGQPRLIERARSAGAKGWIVKPFRPDLLVAAVKKVVGAP